MPAARRIALIGAGVLVLGIGTVVVLNQRTTEEPEPPPVPDPVTTTLALPSPQGEGIEVSESTALIAAMPPVVFDHVLTAQARNQEAFPEHRAIEGLQLSYSAPGSDIDLHILQWDTAAKANAYLEEVLSEPDVFADGEGRRSGDVAVEGESVGRYEIGVLGEPPDGAEEPPSTPAATDDPGVVHTEPLGPGMAVWTNGTVAFVAVGDAARLAQFYDHFTF